MNAKRTVLGCLAMGWSFYAHAQFTADFQTNIISGVTSNWTGDYLVGSNTFADALLIQNGGVLSNAAGYLSYEVSSSNNSVLVSGSGSVWNNQSDLRVGKGIFDLDNGIKPGGSGNSMVVENGGIVVNNFGSVGLLGSSNNNVLVVGAGSMWTNKYGLTVGDVANGNSLIISNGGKVIPSGIVGNNGIFNKVLITGTGSVWRSGPIFVGYDGGVSNSLIVLDGGVAVGSVGSTSHSRIGSGSSGNTVLVSGSGSVWSNNAGLYIGRNGSSDPLVSGNSLCISNGGLVLDASGYIGSFNTGSNRVIVTGHGSVWRNESSLYVGYGEAIAPVTRQNSLRIENGGRVENLTGYVGLEGPSNSAVVAGLGSVWSNSGSLYIGVVGEHSLLIISNSGVVVDSSAFIGLTSSNNTVIVSDVGSAWRTSGTLTVGSNANVTSGTYNLLVITNGGTVSSSSGFIDASNNSVIITGEGSAWANSSSLSIGVTNCSGNTLTISSFGVLQSKSILLGRRLGSQGTLTVIGNGTAVSTNVVLGDAPCTGIGVVTVAGGSVFVTNSTGNAVVDVENGTFTSNSGAVVVDKLVVTNACGRFIRTGGTLSITTTNLDPSFSAVGDGIPNGWKQQYGLDPFDPNVANADNDGDGFSNLQEYLAGTDPTNSVSAFRITSVTRGGNDIRVTWQTVLGRTNALQRATTLVGDYTDIFTITNTVGSATNYLDVGGAIASPRYYRVRLVP